MVTELLNALEKGEGSPQVRTLVEELMALLTPVVLAMASAKLGTAGSFHDAEDVCQETLKGLWWALVRKRTKFDLGKYLPKVLQNQVARHFRKKLRSDRIPAKPPEELESSLPGTPNDASEDPTETRQILESALANEHLDERTRQVVSLRRTGKSLRDIAELLGIGVGEVRGRFDRFADELRRQLKARAGRGHGHE